MLTDLTLLDSFLWGYLKSKVYVNRLDIVEDLKERIRRDARLISPAIIEMYRGNLFYFTVCKKSSFK